MFIICRKFTQNSIVTIINPEKYSVKIYDMNIAP